MKPKSLTRLAALLAVLATAGTSANAQVWLGTQLGSPGQQGSVSTNQDNSLTLVGGGDDIWGNSDNGYYYYTWVRGDFDVKARVQSLATDSSAWAKTELMARFSDPAVGVQGSDGFIAAMCAAGQSPANQHQFRAERGVGAANNLTPYANVALSFPDNWLRLTRTNGVITMYAGPDGTAWTALGTIDTAATTYGFGAPAWPDLLTVGVAVTAHNNDVTTTSVIDPPVLRSAIPATVPTAMSIVTDVQSMSARAGSEASFSFVASNNGTPVPSLYPWTYQWYRNGAAVGGATRSALTWLAQASDSNAKVYCVAQEVAPWNSLSITSATGTLTVTTDTQQYAGALKVEVFDNSGRNDVNVGNVPAGDGGTSSTASLRVPGKLRWLSAFEDNGGYGNYTARRVTGYFIPWVDGSYTFYVAGDDDTDVLLSSDSTPNNKRIICQEPQWSGPNNWTNAGGGAEVAIAQKCSDTWTNGDGTAPNPSGITLKAGTSYYIEMVLHNGTGGDNGGVTAKLFNEPAPANGTASTLCAASNNISLVSWPNPNLTWTAQPTNFTAVDGSSPIIYASTTTPGEMAPHYQWYRAGAAVAGQTRTDYSLGQVLAAHNGQSIYCVASVPGMTITSSVATLIVQSGVFEPGFVLNQRWAGVENRDNAANDLLGTPTFQAAIPALEGVVDNPGSGDMLHYTRKISGLFIPPVTGDYVFFTCSDDASDLYISTDATAVHKYMIAQEGGWSNPWNWTTTGDGTTANLNGVTEQKRSDMWTNSTSANLAPYANGIRLQQGVKYYIESDMQQGVGGGNVEVTYKLKNDPDPANGSDSKLTGTVIGMNAPVSTWVNFTQQPADVSVAPGPNSSATFTANGTTDSKLAVGSIRSTGGLTPTEVANEYVFFQWQKNGANIEGATSSSFTVTGIRGSDNGTKYTCLMRSLGYGTPPANRLWSNSVAATLNVIVDTNVPTVIYAGYYTNDMYIPPATFLSLTFNMSMDPNTLTNLANYTVPGMTVTEVFVNPDYRHVLLTVQGAGVPSGNVTVAGPRSWSGVAMANSSTPAVAPKLTFVDIGADDPNTGFSDPVMPSKLWVDGANAYGIACEGHDIWDAADGFNFLYEQKTGNFDAVLRQTAYTPTDRWSKCGLMVRELIDPKTVAGADAGKSRNWNVVNDPPDVPCLADGNGVNVVETNCRLTNGIASGGWPGGLGVTVHPAYPDAWIRIKRVGQVLSAYAGTNGVTWTKLAEHDVSTNSSTLPDTVYVGICSTAHHNDSWDVNLGGFSQTYWFYPSMDNYNSAYVQPAIGATLTYTVQAPNNLVISWSPAGGRLQTSSSLTSGSWTDVGTANPATIAIPAGAGKAFYRVVNP